MGNNAKAKEEKKGPAWPSNTTETDWEEIALRTPEAAYTTDDNSRQIWEALGICLAQVLFQFRKFRHKFTKECQPSRYDV